MALIIAVNVLMRDRPWTHEWFWAFFNYHFVTVFLGPLAAGLGAWEGARLAKAADILQSSGGSRRAFTAAAGGVLAWLLVVYLTGLAWIVVMVRGAGTPGIPGIIEVSTLVPAMAFLGMWVAVGVGTGFRTGSPLAPPITAVASFAVILILYLIDYDLVRVGGATGSLLGLAPRPELQGGQVVLYLAAGLWSLLWTTRPRHDPTPAAERLPPLAIGVLAIVVAVTLFFDRGDDFRRRPVEVRCTGEPPICLAAGYAARADDVRASFAPYLAGLAAARVPLPERFVMDPGIEEDLVGGISLDVALGDKRFAFYDVLSAYLKQSCEVLASPKREEAFTGVVSWFEAQVGSPPSDDDPAVPEVLKNGSPEEQAAWIRDAIDRLRRCE